MGSLAVLALLLVGGWASAAAPSKDVTIEFRLKFSVQESSSGSLTGTFRSSGAIAASGIVAENYILSPPRLRDQQPVETVDGLSTLNTRRGVIRVAYTGTVSSASATLTVTEGRWAISGASGGFRGLHGHGRFSAIVDLARRTMVKRYDGIVTGAHLSRPSSVRPRAAHSASTRRGSRKSRQAGLLS